MPFNQDRSSIREVYFQSWHKKINGESLNPTEAVICAVIEEHPEYHILFQKKKNKQQNLDKDFSPEKGQMNPFLHMGLHIAIREQLATNRPFGIKGVYTQLMEKHQSHSDVEHMMMDYLVEALMEAQKSGSMPDEQQYLSRLRALI